MTNDEGWTESADGNSLYWRRSSTDSEATAVLLFVHGLAEHSGRYRHVMEHFAGRGFDCWALDYRGHGRSPAVGGSHPRPAAGNGRSVRISGVHVDRFDEFLTDLGAVHRLVRNACPGRPLFMIGHSQGGLITLRYALAHPEDLTAIIVSSPFLGLHPDTRPNALLRAGARLLSAVAPRFMLAKPPDASLLSRDPKVGEAYLADPLVSRSVSARWFTEVVAAHRDTLKRAGELQVPALVMQSGADRLADPAATRAWVRAAPADLVDYVEWEGFYHEMFNEPEKERVFGKVEAWVRSL
ncbi:MAG: lysophospholipase [Thermoanaerobaculales bacterium]